MSAPRYQAYYCQENAWHLCGDPRLAYAEVPAGIVTTPARSGPLCQPRPRTHPA
jgi:hypothetical protein